MPKKKGKKQKNARVRTDTFWTMVDTSIVDYFQKVYDGTHSVYYLDRAADVNLDYNKTPRHCWMVRRCSDDREVPGLLSTNAYRVSLLWSVSVTSFWGHERRRQKRRDQLPLVKTKRGEHTRHRCPNEWCCNPRHFLIGTRAENEADKHFHHFLKLRDAEGTNVAFMDAFAYLCRKQRLWGFYPPL